MNCCEAVEESADREIRLLNKEIERLLARIKYLEATIPSDMLIERVKPSDT